MSNLHQVLSYDSVPALLQFLAEEAYYGNTYYNAELMTEAHIIKAPNIFAHVLNVMSTIRDRTDYLTQQRNEIGVNYLNSYWDMEAYNGAVFDKGVPTQEMILWINKCIRNDKPRLLFTGPLTDILASSTEYLMKAVNFCANLPTNPLSLNTRWIRMVILLKGLLSVDEVNTVRASYEGTQFALHVAVLDFTAPVAPPPIRPRMHLPNPLKDIPNVERIQEHRDLIVNLMNRERVTKSQAKVIQRLYDFPENENYTPRTLRQFVEQAQELLESMCTNSDDFASFDSIKLIPYPFIARLPLPNGSTVCISILDLVLYHDLENPITRERLSDNVILDLVQKVRDLLRKIDLE